MKDCEGIVDRIYEAATVPSLRSGILRETGCRTNAPAGFIATFRTVSHSGIRVSPSLSNPGLDAFSRTALPNRSQAPPPSIAANRAGLMSNQELFEAEEYDADPLTADVIHL